MKLLIIGFLVLSLGCASSYTDTMFPVIRDLNRGTPSQAMDRLRQVFPDSTGRDRLLYLMELGNLARYSGQHTVARSALLAADRLSDLQRGTDIGQQAQSMITSDLALDFRGADYEKVFINYCLAASYASTGDTEEAAVEARRVNEKLAEFNASYGENPNRYSEDAFVRYFMGVLYEMNGDWDDALISYRLALAAYDSIYARDYGLGAPEQLKRDILRLSDYTGFESLHLELLERWGYLGYSRPAGDTGEIVAVVETGSISPRAESFFTVHSEDRIYRMALPVIPDFPRRHFSGSIQAGGRSSSLFLVQDMNSIARENLEDMAGRNVLRAAARLAVKAGVAELGENIAEELTDNENVSSGIGLILSIFGAASERADLRAWLTLPAQIQMARLTLPRGTYPVSVTVNGRTWTAEEVEVIPGEIALVFFREEAGIGPGIRY